MAAKDKMPDIPCVSKAWNLPGFVTPPFSRAENPLNLRYVPLFSRLEFPQFIQVDLTRVGFRLQTIQWVMHAQIFDWRETMITRNLKLATRTTFYGLLTLAICLAMVSLCALDAARGQTRVRTYS